MSWFRKLVSPAGRKSIYGVVIAINALAIAVVPVLQSLGWIDAGVGAKVLELVAGVVAVAGSIVAIKFVPGGDA